MPVRYGGSYGAITKWLSESQRIARTTEKKVIDLTQESEEDEARGGSEAESDNESEEREDSEGQGGSDEQEDHEEGEESEEELSLEEQEECEEHEEFERSQDLGTMRAYPGISYSVTGYHHRPWGGGDEFHTVGIFNTEKEAKWAALKDYRETCEENPADGWEYYWQGDPGDEEITLVAKVEDYEVQQEIYRGTINRIKHMEKPWSPYVTRSDPRIIQGQAESSHVYVVKVQLSEIGSHFCSELVDLIGSKIHNIYREREAANGAALNIYEEFLDLEFPITVKDETKHGLVSIKVDDHDEKVSYLITVEKRELL